MADPITTEDIPYYLQGQPGVGPTPAEAPPTQYGTPQLDQQAMPFRIPYLGRVLDVGRDLLVGPGNENLTTQEQVTRAILNTIILAKAPQALPDVYASNRAGDVKSLTVLGGPELRHRVLELTGGPAPLQEEDAIKQAAQELNLGSGIALPKTIQGLPPISYGEEFKFGQEKQLYTDWDTGSREAAPKVSPNLTDSRVKAAYDRQRLHLPPAPGDLPILKAEEARMNALIPNPTQPEIGPDGRRYDPITRQQIPSTPGSSMPPQGAPQGAPPGAAGPPQTTEPLDPNTVGPATPAFTADSGDHAIPISQIPAKAIESVPRTEWVREYVPGVGDRVYERPVEEKQYRASVEAASNALYALNAHLDARVAKAEERSGVATSELKRTEIQVEAAAAELLAFVTDPETGAPRYDVFPVKDPFDMTGKGAWDRAKYWITQNTRASRIGQPFKGNERIALFVNREGMAAQILARVITKDRVSEQDWATFLKTIPPLDTPHTQARTMLQAMTAQLKDIVAKALEEEKIHREEAAQLRGEQLGEIPVGTLLAPPSWKTSQAPGEAPPSDTGIGTLPSYW